MSIIDPNIRSLYFQKLKDVVAGTLSNLSCEIQKNDKLNKDTFKFKPNICLSMIGCGLPDLSHFGNFDEHICSEDIIECALPILLLNYEVDPEHIWKLHQRVNSQISRVENLATKISDRINFKYCSDNLNKIIQNMIMVTTNIF